jgi:hypothetical protein
MHTKSKALSGTSATTGTEYAKQSEIAGLVTQNELSAATTTLVTQDELSESTSGHALLAERNVFIDDAIFQGISYFLKSIRLYDGAILSMNTDIIGDGGISVIRELELLRSHFTAPTWVTVTLDPANFRDDGYWPEGPQYTKIQYGNSYKVQLRGEVRERDDYLNATDTRTLFNLPDGYRPPKRQLFSCGGGSGGVSASILVNTDGNVLFMPQSSVVEPAESVTTLYLCPISFFTN